MADLPLKPRIPSQFTDVNGNVIFWGVILFALSAGALAYSIMSSRKTIKKTELDIEEKTAAKAVLNSRLAVIEKRLGITPPVAV